MSEETGNGEMTVNAFTNKWCPRGDMQDHDCQMGKDLEGMLESLTRKASLCERMAEALKRAKQDIPAGYIECHGDKCRQSNCLSCNGDDAMDYKTDYIDDLLSEFDREAEK